MNNNEQIVKLSKYKPTGEQIKGIEQYIQSHIANRERIPTIEDMCILLGIGSDTVKEWGRKYTSINRLIAQLLDLQRDYLIRHPSAGNVFLLKSMHDFKETKIIEQNQTYKIDNRPLDIIAGELIKALGNGKDRENGKNREIVQAIADPLPQP